MMNLSSDLLYAIKNQTYHLKPVKMMEKKRRKSSPPEDFNIAKILARRIAMGYGNIEEDNKSVDNNNSIRRITSSGSIKRSESIMSSNSIKSTGGAMSSESSKSVVPIQSSGNNDINSVKFFFITSILEASRAMEVQKVQEATKKM
jgi:hypothetical protein